MSDILPLIWNEGHPEGWLRERVRTPCPWLQLWGKVLEYLQNNLGCYIMHIEYTFGGAFFWLIKITNLEAKSILLPLSAKCHSTQAGLKILSVRFEAARHGAVWMLHSAV